MAVNDRDNRLGDGEGTDRLIHDENFNFYNRVLI